MYNSAQMKANYMVTKINRDLIERICCIANHRLLKG